MRCHSFLVIGAAILFAGTAQAQTPPEIAYVFPPGGAPGTTVDVRIGGYNWTPDMQLFTHDPRVKLELMGPPGAVIVPAPPYWLGKKARDNDLPLPREFPARLTIAADMPPGLVRWQAANANGATVAGVLFIAENRGTPGSLPAVVGQILKLEEVDRHTFTAPRSGPVTLDLWTRRLKSKLNAVLEVRDSAGRMVADAADTAGHDLQLTFAARQNEAYTVSLYDVDFRGHHSFIYRLAIHDGPRVVATLPAAGRRGETRPVEFIGYGLATGEPKLESVTRDVTFPTDPQTNSFSYRLETPFGTALHCTLGVSDLTELIEPKVAPAQTLELAIPAALTGVLDVVNGNDRFSLSGKKGETWSVTCRSALAGLPLDLAVALLDATGKELARADDLPGTTDASLTFKLPADGTYQLAIADSSGQSGRRTAVYRLTVETPKPDFTITLPEMLSVPLAGKISLPVKVVRLGGLAEPITLEFTGLPEGVTVPSPLVIPGNKSDLPVELICAADQAVTASLVTVQAKSMLVDQPLVQRGTLLVAVTMKPRAKLIPEGLDDVRKWPRGTTYPAPVLIERLEGFTGEVRLEQTAHQQRVRQGITGPDFVVPVGVGRVEYPVYMPESLETTKTSRIILNGVTQVPDPRGNVRHLLSKMELRIGMLPVGALLKITHGAGELTVPSSVPFEVPVTLTRSGELTAATKLELLLPESLAGQLTADPVLIPASESTARVRIVPAPGNSLRGEHELTFRATSSHLGKWPVIAETKLVVEFTSP